MLRCPKWWSEWWFIMKGNQKNNIWTINPCHVSGQIFLNLNLLGIWRGIPLNSPSFGVTNRQFGRYNLLRCIAKKKLKQTHFGEFTGATFKTSTWHSIILAWLIGILTTAYEIIELGRLSSPVFPQITSRGLWIPKRRSRWFGAACCTFQPSLAILGGSCQLVSSSEPPFISHLGHL